MRLRLGSVDHDLTTRALVMGVLEGSFAPAGPTSAVSLDRLAGQAQARAGEGADVLDLGAVDDGGRTAVGEDEELGRLLPVVEALRARVDVPLSIDTWRPAVLIGAAAAGVAIATDRHGLGGADYDQAVSGTGVTIVMSHNRALAAPSRPGQASTVDEVRALLSERVARARAAGIPDERMIVDAGLDLGKAPQQSLALLRGSAALADIGPPVLLDASNKRFLGLLLDLDVGERRMAGHAAAALGIARGCRVVRSHDVLGARRVADVLAAVLGARLAQVRSNHTAEVGGG